MRRSQTSFISSMFFAFSVIVAPSLAAAQDMPPILAPLNAPTAPANLTPAPQATSPSAEAIIPPAVVAPVAPVRKPQITVAKRLVSTPEHRVATAAEKKKFAALLKKLATVRRETAHHETVRRVAVRASEPSLPPGTIVAPPGYYSPGSYQRLVYAGPYSGWNGFRRPYPYYNYP